MQMRLMVNKKGFRLAYFLNLGYILLTYGYYVWAYWGSDLSVIPSPDAVFPLQSTSVFFDIYINLVPFVVVLPFALSYADDAKNMLLPVLQVRSGIRTYYVSKGIACFAGGFAVFFLPLMFSILLNNFTFPDSGITFIGDLYDLNYDARITGANVLAQTRWGGLWFPKLFIYSPGMYNFLFCFLFSAAMGIFCTFVYVVSFVMKRQKLLLLLPLYLLISCLNIMDVILFRHTPYQCYKVLLYLTVNTMHGKNPMYIYLFFLAMTACIFGGIHWQIKRDQLN